MGRVKIRLAIEIIISGALVFFMVVLPACRKEEVPLDRNKEPETFLTNSPTETTATEYRVHMYWHGEDEDGAVVRYIWYISDTLMTLDPEGNPDAELLQSLELVARSLVPNKRPDASSQSDQGFRDAPAEIAGRSRHNDG